MELERAPAIWGFHDHVRSQNIRGHQVGRELDTVEVEIEGLGERAHQKRLAESGDAFQEAMAADEEARQYPMDDLLMPHDHLADLFPHLPVTFPKLLCSLLDRRFVPIIHQSGSSSLSMVVTLLQLPTRLGSSKVA